MQTVSDEAPRPNLFTRLKNRYEVGNGGVALILLSFSLAGATVLRVSHPIMHLILPENPPRWLWWTVRIGVIVPVYELLLVTYGVILGQRRFFIGKRLRGRFRRRRRHRPEGPAAL